jgi:hypothetical protein
MDILSHSVLHRAGEHIGSASRREQTSIDFLINESSLLNELVRRSGGHSDLMGCLAKGLPEFKSEVVSKLAVDAPPDTESGRVILYQCPECGDIACGAYTALVERDEGAYIWRSFAYENGYEPAALVADFGPFRFESHQYVAAIANAANAL